MISIIIPTYNRVSILEKTFPSYQNQKGVGEIIVVDDGSTDSTKDMIKKFQNDPRIKYIAHSTKQGGPQTKLTGIQHSSGDYILFGEDDLIFSDTYAETLLEDLKKNDADVCAGRIIYLKNNESFDNAVLRLNRIKKPVINYNTLEGTFGVKLDRCTEVPFVHACHLVKKEKITEIDFDVKYLGNGYREETDPQISMLKKGCKIIFCPNALCYHLPKLNTDVGGHWSKGGLYYLFWTMKNNSYFLNKHYVFLREKYALKPKIIIISFMTIHALKFFLMNSLGKIKRTFFG